MRGEESEQREICSFNVLLKTESRADWHVTSSCDITAHITDLLIIEPEYIFKKFLRLRLTYSPKSTIVFTLIFVT